MSIVLRRLDTVRDIYPLGRHIEHDERSRAYAAIPKLTLPLGRTTHWPSSYRVLNQGERSSCTGNALAQWKNTKFAKPVKALTERNAVQIYSLATTLDEFDGQYPPDDTGSSALAACKAGVRLGLIGSYTWVFSWTSLQATIEKTPLLAGTVWTGNMFYPVNGLVTVGSLSESNIAAGHEYLMCGIDYQNAVVEYRQSWGSATLWPGCKPGGYFAISFKDTRRLQDLQGDYGVPQLRS